MKVHIDMQPHFIEFIFRCAPVPLFFMISDYFRALISPIVIPLFSAPHYDYTSVLFSFLSCGWFLWMKKP